jgi:hypothetical protein
MEICNEPFNDVEGNPVVNPVTGDFYVPCAPSSATPQVTRIAANGTITTKVFSAYNGSNSSEKIRRSALVMDASNKPWLAWPDNTGVLLIDLSTFDQAAPTTQRITLDPNWSTFTVDDATADPYRHAYLAAYNRPGTTAQLVRVKFGATRAADAPLDLGNIGNDGTNGYVYLRMALRVAQKDGMTEPDPGPDLVVQPASIGNEPVPHVDLDNWSMTTRVGTDYFLGSSAGIFASPDPRYYVAPTIMNHETGAPGMYLYPWDPTLPRMFVDLTPVPTGGSDWPGRTETSLSGNLMVITEGDVGAGIDVIYFLP